MTARKIVVIECVAAKQPVADVLANAKPKVTNGAVFLTLSRNLAKEKRALVVIPGNKIIQRTAVQIAAFAQDRLVRILP
ncbi:hypothetical protein CFSAN004346_22065 [Salmonella enterica subsp. enterica serovar Montevideo str. CFSAN004346]|nr:hypothetical protein CFSAN004346_22065 [Salmonella enterica subsp. enterica serovar Montevideo str. CFSAN004346]